MDPSSVDLKGGNGGVLEGTELGAVFVLGSSQGRRSEINGRLLVSIFALCKTVFVGKFQCQIRTPWTLVVKSGSREPMMKKPWVILLNYGFNCEPSLSWSLYDIHR
ncbi:hypothetical protein VNO80_19938 [Phaseolus coccineus]|uniref:Uncharacterized protein n=1 Tax=Phaseolus coccineus TaxID=3886 RepID=A0AAN9MKI1_PHACN